MGKYAMVPALMRENAAANMAGVRQALNIVVVHPRGALQVIIKPLNVVGIIAGKTAIAMERPAIAAAMDIIGITIITMGVNKNNKIYFQYI